MKDYDKYIYKGAKAEADPLKGDDMAKAAADAAESAAGTDQWGPGELSKSSPLAYERIAQMLNNIEMGRSGRKR